MEEERLTTRTYALALVAIVGVALALRLFRFGSIPPGLYHDEAYNGLDALSVLRGAHPLWFTANNGREPLFIYLVALSAAALGRTVVAVRAPALALGLLTVPATAFLGTSLFDRRVGLLSAAVTAITFWPVQLSRTGLRAVGLPFFLALALGFLWRGLRYGRRRDYVLAGLLYGASFYTYLAARFTPLPLLLLAGLLVWPAARLPRPRWTGLLLAGAVAVVTAAPLVLTVLRQDGGLTGRIGQVSVFNPAISHGDPWGTLGRDVLLALEAFFIRGDRIPRHNLPWRPIFDPGLGLAFLVGAAVALRRRGAGWFVLLWVGAMLLPTILAEDTPHYLRAVGVQPLVFVVPALGLDWVWGKLAARKWGVAGAALSLLILLGGLASTADAYFRRYAAEQTVYYHFEAGSVGLAARINAFLQADPSQGPGTVYLSRRLWQDWPSLRFLVPKGSNVQVVQVSSGPPVSGASRALLVTWPFEEYRPSLALLPRQTTLEVTEDLYERGDLEPEARLLALVFRAAPYGESGGITVGYVPGQELAVLEHGISLVAGGVEVVPGQKLRVRLVWGAGEALPVDYTVTVQVLRGQALLGQHDGQPAGGRLPTSAWRPGDHVVDVHEVDLRAPYDPKTDRVIVGLYDLATMARLRVVDAHAPALDDAILVGAP